MAIFKKLFLVALLSLFSIVANADVICNPSMGGCSIHLGNGNVIVDGEYHRVQRLGNNAVTIDGNFHTFQPLGDDSFLFDGKYYNKK